MSYCRFSSENGYCDVYVYESVDGGWITHVAGNRWPEGAPPDPYSKLFSGDLDKSVFQKLIKDQSKWREDNPLIEINHPEAGSGFRHETPRECAENLIRLRSEGFQVPQYAIDDLLAESEGKNDNDTKP